MRLSLITLFFLTTSAMAHDMPAPAEIPKNLEAMKRLAGTWEGTTKMEGKETPVKAIYEVTSGGTAIVEKLMPGTPQEMVTIFHKDGKNVSMEHYCAIGNQPHMALKKADDKSYIFEMNGTAGISSPKEMHMHALTITFIDADTMREDWTNFQNGKKAEVATFTFHRKKM